MADEIKNQAAENEAPEQSVNELRQIRVDKLTALQEAGKDPFEITKYEVTAYAADIKANFEALENQTVSVAGRIMSVTNQDLRGTAIQSTLAGSRYFTSHLLCKIAILISRLCFFPINDTGGSFNICTDKNLHKTPPK